MELAKYGFELVRVLGGVQSGSGVASASILLTTTTTTTRLPEWLCHLHLCLQVYWGKWGFGTRISAEMDSPPAPIESTKCMWLDCAPIR